ncbi:MAG: GAF domain-containing protein, partial [Anaerolineae bacterium]
NLRAVDANAHAPVFHDQEWRQRDLVCAPLFGRHQQKIGLIGLDKPRNGRRPDTAMLQTIELYAQFAAAAIETSQLAAETMARNREIETLLAANQAISGILEPEAILALTAEHMLAAVQADGVTIFEWREDGNLIVLHDLNRQPDAPTLAKDSRVLLAEDGLGMTVLNENKPALTAVAQTNDAPLPSPPWLPDGTAYTVALVPLLLSDEQTYGLVQVIHTDPKEMGAYQLELLNALSGQAGTALDNALIFEETYERERFYNALGSVSLAINYTLDRDTVLDLIASESARMFGVDSAYIWLIEENQFAGRAAYGENSEAFVGRMVPLSDEAAFVSQVYRGGTARHHNHVSQNERLNLRLPEETAVQAILGVPIEQEGQIIAILILVDTQNPNRFSYKEVTQAATFGVQVAIALKNAQLFEELRRFNEELDTRVANRTRELNEESTRVKILLRITSDLSASLDQDRVLSQALQLVNEVINAVQGSILLIDPETDELIFRATMGMDMTLPREGLPSGMKRGEGLAGWMIDNRSPVIVSDTQEDPRWVHRTTSAEYRSVLGVPLITTEEVIGVLMLFHTKPNAFTMQQADLVEAAAIQVASAINNANLYLLIRDQAERLGSMLRAEQIEAAKSQSILESIADGVLVADENNRVILTNVAASTILEVPRQELVGKPVNELLGLYGRSGESWVDAFNDWSHNADRIEPGTFLADRFEIEDKVVSVHLSPVLS